MEIKTLIKENSSKSRDPYVLYYNDLYYYCFSRDDKIYLSASKELDSIEKQKEIIVYKNEDGLKNLWAPELHIIDGKCYIYVACDDGDNENHRMYVLYNNSNNPLLEYKNKGIISDASNKWAIDGTVLNYRDELYFIWSGCDKNIHHKQEIFIAKMNNPFEISGNKVMISTPEYSWEKHGGDGKSLAFVNEGPAAIIVNDRLYIIYSASGCWCDHYCLGMLKLVGNDILSKDSWVKYNKPVFSSKNGLIGPGHCSFITKDNNEVYMFLHSFNNKENLSLENVNARYIKLNLLKKGTIIAGFSGIGKTTLAKKYKNVIDLDASEYAYDEADILNIDIEKRKGEHRKPNPNWPDNYIEAIEKAIRIYDIVLVWDREDIIKEYLKNGFNFMVCYPSRNDLENYVQRYKSRGNSDKYIEMKLKGYDERLKLYDTLNVPKIILNNNETLEDWLIKNNYLLKGI